MYDPKVVAILDITETESPHGCLHCCLKLLDEEGYLVLEAITYTDSEEYGQQWAKSLEAFYTTT